MNRYFLKIGIFLILTVFTCLLSERVYADIQYQYWFDNDTESRISGFIQDETGTIDLDLKNEKPGFHIVSFRASYDGKMWSTVKSVNIVKLPEAIKEATGITAYKWWTDELHANTVELPFTPLPNELIVPISPKPSPLKRENTVFCGMNGTTPQFASLTPINFQIRDDHGNWSLIERGDTVSVKVPAVNTELTGFITNPDALQGKTGWKWTGATGQIIQDKSHWTGEKRPYFCMGNPSSNGFTTTMTQTIEGLPAGVYLLSAYGRANTDVTMRMSVGDDYVEFPSNGAEAGELWENASSDDPALGLENGGGWSHRTLVFATDGNPFEIMVSGTTTKSGQWFDISDFSLRLHCTGEFNLQFPEDTDMSKYRNMRLRLEGDGRVMSQVVSDRTDGYRFKGVAPAYNYRLSLVNNYGHTVAYSSTLKLNDESTDVFLSDFKPLLSPYVSVVGPGGETDIDDCTVEWYDSMGNIIARGDTLYRVPEGEILACKAILSDRYGKIFKEPEMMTFIPTEESQSLIISLEEISTSMGFGEVLADNMPLVGASVAVTEYVNGKYPNTYTAITDKDGTYAITLRSDSCRVTVMADGYADQVQEMKITDNRFAPIVMKHLSGSTVSLSWTYKEATVNGPVETDNRISLSDIYVQACNLTSGRDSVPVIKQNGRLMISDVSPGDRIELRLNSTSSLFAPTECCFTINEDMTAQCDAILIESGKIEIQYASSQNKSDKALLFNASGDKVMSGVYTAQKVNFENLAVGRYTIMSFNADIAMTDISNISVPTNNGWVEGNDYVLTSTDVSDGYISSVTVGNIPRGSAQVRHIGEKASFSSRKNIVTAGNFLTLNGIIDFDELYKEDVSDMTVIIDIPKGVEYIDNSTMVGNHINNAEVFDGKLLIPIDDDDICEQIRFCLMPIEAGVKAIQATLEFSLMGTKFSEPLGCAGIQVEKHKMTVPPIVNTNNIVITGLAPSNSHLILTDNGIIIGETNAQSDGKWKIECRLSNQFHLTDHEIQAKIIDTNGRNFLTDSYPVFCDFTTNEIKNVTMINTAHNSQNLNTCQYTTEFNFENPAEESPVYWYWPKYPTFTFQTKYSDNSPEKIKNSIVEVKTSDGNIRNIKTVYDAASDSWVGRGEFQSNSLPANVSVTTNDFNDIELQSDPDLMASAYAGIVMSKNPFINNDYDIQISESSEESSVKIKIADNDKNVSSTIKTYSIDKIPDKSTDGYGVTRWEADLKDCQPLTILVDEVKDKLMVFVGKKFMKEICEGLDKLAKTPDMSADSNKIGSELIEHEIDMIDQKINIQQKNEVLVSEIDNFFDFLTFLKTAACLANDMNKTFMEYYALMQRYMQLKTCDEDLVDPVFVDACIKDLKRSFDIYFCVKGISSFSDWAADKIKYKPLQAAVKVTSKAGILASNAGKYISKKGASNRLMAFEQVCGIQNGNRRESGSADAIHVLDPSGYVYEAVTSNRLSGVTATVYKLRKEEDMYGDIHEIPEMWNASAYSQRNPVITDDTGVYAWDVPQGEWQVRFEKEGYEPTSTEWLPVPPPQLEINVGMTHAVAPDAVGATAFETGIVVEFDKYIQPSSLSSNSIKAFLGKLSLQGKIEPENMEEDPYTGRSFASKMRLSLNKALTVGDTVNVIVGDSPLSYAGIEMQGERRFCVEVQPELKEIVADSVIHMHTGTSTLIPVYVLPAKSAIEKKIRVFSASPSIVASAHDVYTIDSDGVALVELRSLLPGTAIISLSIDGYDLSMSIRVESEITDESSVSIPVSSVTSGNTVTRGTTVELTTDTPDAQIWYTLDGTCPCLKGSKILYTSPIVVTEDMILKAQAFKEGLAPSEIAVFHYIVEDSGMSYPSANDISIISKDGRVEINAPNGSHIEIYDTEGMIVETREIENNLLITKLQKGEVFFIHVSSKSGVHRTFKVIL